MIIRTFVPALLVLAILVTTAAPGWASTVSECQAMIANLKAETQQVTITGRNAEKDRAGLVGKLDAARLALDRAKFCDPIQKLNDFRAKVIQLIDAGRINQEPAAGVTAEQLLAEADATVTSRNQLKIQATGIGCF